MVAMSHQRASHSAKTAPMLSAHRVPIASITGANNMLPIGTVPPKAILARADRKTNSAQLAKKVLEH